MGTQYNEFVYPNYLNNTNFWFHSRREVRGMFEFKGRFQHSAWRRFLVVSFYRPEIKSAHLYKWLC